MRGYQPLSISPLWVMATLGAIETWVIIATHGARPILDHPSWAVAFATSAVASTVALLAPDDRRIRVAATSVFMAVYTGRTIAVILATQLTTASAQLGALRTFALVLLVAASAVTGPIAKQDRTVDARTS